MHSEKEFIFGMHPVMEAIRGGRQIDRVLVRRGLRGGLYHELMQVVNEYAIPWQVVPQEKLDYITRKNHQGVIAWLSAIEFQNIENIVPRIFEEGGDPLLLMLDGVSDVRNFGAIVRSALCFGAHAVIIPEKNSARISPDAVKASAGALSTFPVCRVKSLTKCLTWLRESGLKAVAATEKAEKQVSDAGMTGPLVVILGSEERGISRELLELSDAQVSIPITGTIGSLNVSVSAGILLYEIVRQKQIRQ
ncbi:MAG TPA: 23S rRNA (guanosine(2251)-2'-O)-methyltransferase RlmB [Bacteroidales bacterium]|nr:23S rRNA (guanosine(2251)-2'-O)-methyltransferase RlmB [Bacteroidales bacterium]